uniref:uncharacterized protein LOC131139401 n=1 Tax=Doryrhamphus excisus TaxID=161450 RepID=UPI0025AE6565|nr:uncharacterized protein LOC131139401 [Doryrhamphus excisus]
MFTGDGVVSGHFLTGGTFKPYPGLEVNTKIQMENGQVFGAYPTYQGQVCTDVSLPKVANDVSNSFKVPPPLPVPPPALKLGQEGFKKVCRTEENNPCPFPGLASGVPPPLPVPPTALKLGQEGFKKVCRTEENSPCPFPGLASGVPPPLPVPPPALKLGQEGFKKVCRTEENSPCPFPGLASGVLEMRVKEGSKIRNLMGFAMARMQGGDGGGGEGSGLRQVVFTGSGRAVTKTITCAEIMKRKVGSLHQLTKLQYKVVKEVWENTDGGTSEMTVHRTVPSISILLSKDPLDPREPGYQPPETLGALWEERDGGTQSAFKRPLTPSPLSSFPLCKRVCSGEGVSVLPPH